MFFFLSAALAQSTPTWEETLDTAVPAVVALKVSATRPFDTDKASNTVGTGFVVDAERGLILTNRHMVHPGPVFAEAVFLNNEEVALSAVYRDPVHDFGIYRFDPESVRHMDLVALELRPEEARVGEEIRVVGNDAGEKIVILDGTLARLDRAAPSYGSSTYNDFNTFYYQAGSGTSGGSSGSPVLNQQGHVIALNAGGKRRAASSFYLPLDRVVRALDFIRQGDEVPRGTLQTTFVSTPYDELARLGLARETEALARETFDTDTGLLVVHSVVREGPAWQQLRPGDVLVRVNGALVNAFVPLEAVLDESVGQTVTLDIERGGEPLQLELSVQDLHAITPAAFLDVGGGVAQEVSYQLARNHNVPVDGVVLIDAGSMWRQAGIGAGSLIEMVDGAPIESLDDLFGALGRRAHGERIPVRFRAIQDPRSQRVGVLVMDRLWTGLRHCTLDTSGHWPCEEAPEAPEAPPAQAASTTLETSGPRVAQAVAPSLVVVEYDLPMRVAGVRGTSFTGAGLVVDAERGLVVCDRDTVPVELGEATLTFGRSLRVPATVRFVHPTHNLAVVQYDPALIGDTPVRAATLRDKEIAPGDRLFQVVLTGQGTVASQRTQVSRIDPMQLPLPSPPYFRESNVEVVAIADWTPSMGGVLTDRRGRVVALWSSFVYQTSEGRDSIWRGLPIQVVAEVVEALREGRTLRTLGAELATVALADARERGLSAERAEQLADHDPERKQALMVSRVAAGTDAARHLQGGDLLLAANGLPVTRFAELEAAASADRVLLTVLRDGTELELSVGTTPLDGLGVDRVVQWSGLVLHEPHWEVASQRGLEREGVYVSWFWYGSPAHRYKLRATNRIVAVNGVDTPDLDAFLSAVEGMEEGTSVRLTLVDLDEQERVYTVKVSPHFWPTSDFVRGDDGAWSLSGEAPASE